MNTASLGNLSLNISFVLYLILYFPQLRHNRTPTHLAELSIGLHVILSTSFCLDLIYAYLKPLPWQYLTVSVVALSLLSVQHLQLMRQAYRQHKKNLVNQLVGFFILACLGLVYVFLTDLSHTSSQEILGIGYISRLGFLSYTLPQIIQNHRRQSAQALSTAFLSLSLLLSSLDLISAWCLDWGWPNKLGTPIALLFTLTLLWQKARTTHPTLKALKWIF